MRRTLTAQRPASPTWGSRIILLGAAALIAIEFLNELWS